VPALIPKTAAFAGHGSTQQAVSRGDGRRDEVAPDPQLYVSYDRRMRQRRKVGGTVV
jgi:hypothetical protein